MKATLLFALVFCSALTSFAFTTGVYKCSSASQDTTYNIKEVNLNGVSSPYLEITTVYRRTPTTDEATYVIKGFATEHIKNDRLESLSIAKIILELNDGIPRCVKN